ncbi:MAG: c-type cytochrome biogenesis protein CcmI [Gammaproteobacteria bacterium]
MLLWVTIAALTLAVTAIIVWPLFSRRPAHAAPGDELERRLAVFRDRRDEIGREHAAGRIGDSEAAQAQADLLRQMTEELPAEELAAEEATPASEPSLASGARSRAPLYAGLAVALLVPLVALGVYRGVGSPEVALAQRGGADAGDNAQAQFDALLAQIQDRLKANPKDGEAWAVLGEAYKLVGNHGAAIEAFEHAVELMPPNSRLLADYAESTALAAGGDFKGRPTELLERALQADPNDQKAVALMGAARYRAGNLPEARRYLQQLLASLPPESDYAAQIGQVVARIGAEMGETGPEANGGAAAGVAGQRSGPAPAPSQPASGPLASTAPSGAVPSGAASSAATPSAAARPTTPAPAATVRGTVTLASGLAQRVPPGATLFIVARAAEGPRIPVAVLRVPSPRLPMDFELGDANAMDPSRLLSSTAAISLEARLSGSGTAMRSAGDLYGAAATVKPGASGITIEIDKVVGP